MNRHDNDDAKQNLYDEIVNFLDKGALSDLLNIIADIIKDKEDVGTI